MKKIYLFKMFLMAFVLMLLGGVNASAVEKTSTLTFTSQCNGSGTANDNVKWTVASDAAESDFDNTKGIHYGSKSIEVSYLTLTTSDISGTIKKIVVNASGASKTSANLDVTVGGSTFGEKKSLSATATYYTFEGSASGEIVVKLSQTSAKKALYVKSISVTYETSSTPTTNNIKFSKDAGTYEKAPVSVELSASVDGSTIYYSIDGNKPTKDEEHKYSSAINITKSGTVLKVLATADGYDDAEAEAKYIIKPAQPVFSEESKTFKKPLNVTLSLPETKDNTSKIYYAIGSTATAESTLYDGNPITIDAPNDGDKVILHAVVVDEYGNVGTEKRCTYTKTTAVIFDFTANPWGIVPTEDNTKSNTDGRTDLVVDGVKLTTTSSSSTNTTKTCIYKSSSGIDLRVYTGGALTFTAPEDYTISKIVFTGTVSLNTDVEVGTLASKVWTKKTDVNSVVFTRKDDTSKIETVTITLVPSVENKTMVATDKEAFYSTFSCDRDVVFTEDVKVYAVNVTEGKLELAELTKGNYNTTNSTTENVTNGYYVPANTGVLIKATKQDIKYYTAATGQTHANIPANNQLVAATTNGKFEGVTGYKYYKLAYDDYEKKTGLGFYYGEADGAPFVVKKGLAYLAVPVSVSGSNLAAGYAFGGNGGDDTTGINGIENDNVNETQTIYNLQGQRVEKAGLRGIYIVNGKKVVLK